MRSPRCRSARLASCIALVLALLPFASCLSVDKLQTTDGTVHLGRVFDYDEYSYIVLPEEGGKVIVPRKDAQSIEQKKRRPRYSKRANLITSVERIDEEDSPGRILRGRLIEQGKEEKVYGLEVEAQTLLYLMDSQDQYADTYRTVYERGGTKYELDYAREKDLLLRRWRVPSRGTDLKVLGARGQGYETLLRAAKGRIREEKNLISRMYEPGRRPLNSKPRETYPKRSFR